MNANTNDPGKSRTIDYEKRAAGNGEQKEIREAISRRSNAPGRETFSCRRSRSRFPRYRGEDRPRTFRNLAANQRETTFGDETSRTRKYPKRIFGIKARMRSLRVVGNPWDSGSGVVVFSTNDATRRYKLVHKYRNIECPTGPTFRLFVHTSAF